MKNSIGNLSIRTKLMLSFFLISVVSSLVIFYNMYRTSIENSERISLNFSQLAVEQTAKLIKNYLESCENTCAYIASDEDVKFALSSDHPGVYPETEAAINGKLMQLHKSVIPSAYAFYVIGENGFQYKSVSQRMKSQDLNEEMFYWKVINSKSTYWDGPKLNSQALNSQQEPFLSVGKCIYNSEGNRIGIVAIEIQERVISAMLMNDDLPGNEAEKGLSLDFVCLLDKTFRIVSHTDPNKIGTQMPNSVAYSQSTESKERYNSEYLTVSEPIGERWIVMGGTNLPRLRVQSTAPFATTILIFLLVVILSLLLSVLISAFIANPIKRMTELMQDVEQGNLSVHIKMKYYDEIGIMGRVFNSMLEQLKIFMERTHENEKRLMILQYDILREQIKPHFMYNTLDSLRWLARDGKTKDVEQLALSLMKFYRIHLNNGEDIIRMGEEIEHVNSYLVIQKIRYGNEILAYDIDIPEEIIDCRIVKLTLQPLVENAIYHGLRNANGGSIFISASYDNNNIVLCVRDTGAGIPAEKLRELNGMLQSDASKVGFGLRNVNVRLKLKYGSQYGLRMESEVGNGTSVFVTIPRTMNKEA